MHLWENKKKLWILIKINYFNGFNIEELIKIAYAIDLFSGAGGMSEGILQAGFNILFSSDINESVEKTYINRHEQLGLKQNKNTCFYRCDIKDLTWDIIKDKISSLETIAQIPQIDAIFGGPPCQGFSKAGKRNPNDPRNMLFKEYLRLINEIQPKYVVLENVTGFCDTVLNDFKAISNKIYNTTVPKILKDEFKYIKYEMLEPKILNSADYGVPQKRNRIIVIAYKKGLKKPNYPEPTTKTAITLDDAIGDLLNKDNPHYNKTPYQLDSISGRTPSVMGKTIHSHETCNNEFSKHLEIVQERFSLFKEGESGSSLKRRIEHEGIDLTNKNKLLELLANKTGLNKEDLINKFKNGTCTKKEIDILLTKKNTRTKLDSNEPSPTVLTIPDDYILPKYNRTLTVRECARLQSFDDSFEFLGKRTTGGKRRRIEVPQYSQVGNAVPPLLARAIAKEIIKVL